MLLLLASIIGSRGNAQKHGLGFGNGELERKPRVVLKVRVNSHQSCPTSRELVRQPRQRTQVDRTESCDGEPERRESRAGTENENRFGLAFTAAARRP
jgi:hypothetical protein